MPLQPGEILNNRYRIEEALAVGGMGAVYRAFDTILHIQVALKENIQTGDFFIRQFHLEAKLLAGLVHPNLPRVTDHFTLGSECQYLVMDFIDGIDLRQRISQTGTIPEEEVIRIGAVVCDALAYLHARQPAIVHRDIKPGNIKITPSGQIFLVDFGLAKIDPEGKTSTGAQAFTPGYSPPEQYGQGTETRSDIYALGATLYACLTGEIPPDGLERAMGNSTLTPILKINPRVSPKTAQAIEKAMNVRLEQRFANPQEFRSTLVPPTVPIAPTQKRQPPVEPPRTALPRTPVVQQPDGYRYPPPQQPPAQPQVAAVPPRSSRQPILWAAAILFLIVLIAGGVVFAMLIAPKPAPTALAIIPQVTAETPTLTSQPTQTETAQPTATDLPSPSPTDTLSPTQTLTPTQPAPTTSPTPAATPQGGGPGQIAFSLSQGDKTQIWLTGIDGSGLFQVTNLPDGACQPDWSPDSERIVFVSPCQGRQDTYSGASLFIIKANGTGLIPLATLPGGDFDPAWSPDGKTIAFTSLRSGKANIYLYDLATNLVTRISSPVNIERRPAWSSDGSQIAYETRRNGPSQIWIMNSDGKNMREFSTLNGSSSMPAWAPFDSATPGKGLIVYSQGTDQPYLTGREFDNPAAEEGHINEKVTGIQDARFSPDGWWLVYTQVQAGGSSSIFFMMRNGGSVSALHGTEKGFHPAWRPAK